MDSDDNVVPLRSNLQVLAMQALEQKAHDTLVEAINEVIEMGLTAAQITGLLYVNLRRLSEEADEW